MLPRDRYNTYRSPYQKIERTKLSGYFGNVLNNIINALNILSADVKDEIVIEKNVINIPNKYIVLVDTFKVNVVNEDGEVVENDVVGWSIRNGEIFLPVIPFSYDDISELKAIVIEFPYEVKVLINNNDGFGPALSFI